MKIEVWQGDITTLAVDAIVNAANESLLGGGGVDGAIHRAAGPGLLAECRQLPEVRPGVRCPTGDVVATGAHALPARYIFHTAGPVWQGGQRHEAELLANCYWKCLQLAEKLDLASIAFPAISCGIYGYPVHQAAGIAATETVAWLRSHPTPRRIILVAYNTATFQACQHALLAAGQSADGDDTPLSPAMAFGTPPPASLTPTG